MLITDSHFSRGQRYVNYQSRNGIDYDDLIDHLLEQTHSKTRND